MMFALQYLICHLCQRLQNIAIFWCYILPSGWDKGIYGSLATVQFLSRTDYIRLLSTLKYSEVTGLVCYTL